MNRKPISKKTRFEVFKRDKFTCQYCGASAPEVVMEIDHIVPVASGGDSNIMNLITSCYSCNRGKSYRELSDNSALAKQKKQLDNLQERKEQLQLLAKWRKGLIDLDTEAVNIVCKEIENCYHNQYSVNDTGKMNIAKWLKKFTLQELFEAIKASSQYLEIKKESYTANSVGIFFDKIPRIAQINKMTKDDPELAEAYHLRNLLKKRFPPKHWDFDRLKTIVIYTKEALSNDYTFDELRKMIYTVESISEYKEKLGDLIHA